MKPSCQVGPEAAHLVWLTRDKAASILNVASDCASLDAPRDPLLLPPKYSVASSLVVPKGQANGEGERGWCEGGAGAEGGARVEGGGGLPNAGAAPILVRFAANLAALWCVSTVKLSKNVSH